MTLSEIDNPKTRERIRQQMLRDDQANHSRPIAVMESNPGDATLAPALAKEPDTRRFLVRVTSIRKRLLDQDNLCEKYHVDCCRYAGILPSDAPGQTTIEVNQRKAGKDEEERTEVTITPLAQSTTQML